MEILDEIKDFLLIAFGSVLGVNIRFIIFEKLAEINLSKNYIVLGINIFSSFSLGFLLSILSKISFVSYSDQLVLFLSIGLLGSLSTFSTFISDLYQLLIKIKIYRAFQLFIISLTSGIISFTLGFILGIH